MVKLTEKDMLKGGLELNGLSNLWIALQEAKAGHITQKEFEDVVTLNTKALYDYMRIVAKELGPNSSIPPWWFVRDIAEEKLKNNPNGIHD
jgi:hypothetical protein